MTPKVYLKQGILIDASVRKLNIRRKVLRRVYIAQCIISSKYIFHYFILQSNVTYPFLWITLYEVGSNQVCIPLPGDLDLLVKDKNISPSRNDKN